MSYFEYNHTKLYYETYGSNIPVLLIHGWGIDHRFLTGCMEPVFQLFSDSFERFYVDLPGMGNSLEGDVCNTEDILEVLTAFIHQTMKSRPFLLIGNSYGGMLSRVLAQRMSELIKGMLLICPATGLESPALPTMSTRKREDDFLATLTQPQRENFEAMNVFLTKEAWNSYERDIYHAVLQNRDKYFLHHVLDGSLSTVQSEAVNEAILEQPVLILTGRQDSSVGYEDQFGWMKQYPAATYLALEGAGHNLPIDRPELFNNIVTDWITYVISLS